MLSYSPLNIAPLYCVLPQSLKKDAKYLQKNPQPSPTTGDVFSMYEMTAD